jgi:hypothetical protein
MVGGGSLLKAENESRKRKPKTKAENERVGQARLRTRAESGCFARRAATPFVALVLLGAT